MAPASPITTTTTVPRQSVVVSPSDRVRAGSVESLSRSVWREDGLEPCACTPESGPADGMVAWIETPSDHVMVPLERLPAPGEERAWTFGHQIMESRIS